VTFDYSMVYKIEECSFENCLGPEVIVFYTSIGKHLNNLDVSNLFFTKNSKCMGWSSCVPWSIAWRLLNWEHQRYYCITSAAVVSGLYSFTTSSWLENVYPKLPKSEKPIECVQKAGEIMYVVSILPCHRTHLTWYTHSEVCKKTVRGVSKARNGLLDLQALWLT